MSKHTITFTELPTWAMPDAPSKLALFEVIALAGLEGQWVRLSAADQRALMGFAVFGKQEFKVEADGTVFISRKTCFGDAAEVQDYTPARVNSAAARSLRLSPGTFGPRYA